MEIKHIHYEEKLIVIKNDHQIKITAYVTGEKGHIKFGIEAPNSIAVNREEVFKRKHSQLKTKREGR